MEKELYHLKCVNCKTDIMVKSTFNIECKTYKLVFCPNCKTPIREIKSDIELDVEKAC